MSKAKKQEAPMRASLDSALERELRANLELAFPHVFDKKTRTWAKPAEIPSRCESPSEIADWLLTNRFVQTSRAYKMLGRVPQGMTGVGALGAIDFASRLATLSFGHEALGYWYQRSYEWARRLDEGSAYSHFARCWAGRVDGCRIELVSSKTLFWPLDADALTLVTLHADAFELYRKRGGGPHPWWL